MFEVLRELSEEDQLFVWRSLGDHQQPDATVKERLAIDALRRCQEELGGVAISKGRYETWRAGHPEKESLPSSKLIANSLGSTWSAAISRLGLFPVVEHRGRRLRRLGSLPTNDEALDALAECAQALQTEVLSWAQYRAWALEVMRTEGREPPLLISTPTFIRRFGSWPEALQRAGLTASHNGRAATPRVRYSSRHLIWCLRQAAEGLDADGGSQVVLTTVRYERWREGAGQPEGPDRGTTRPNFHVIMDRFGSWPQALSAAELMSSAQAASYHRGAGRQWPVEHVAEILLEAYTDLDGQITQAPYTRWRAARHRAPDKTFAPCARTLMNQYGRLSGIADTISEMEDPSVEQLAAWLRDHHQRSGR
jgi:hypothetical protein